MPPDVSTLAQQMLLPGNRRIRAVAGQVEFRYEEWRHLDIYVLRSFTETIETTGQGRLSSMSDDLKAIVDLGKLGGHLWGDSVLWFITDDQFNLLEFISPTE